MFDGGKKKVNGRKRHIAVGTLGLVLTVMVTAAPVTDRDAGRTLLKRLRERYWRISPVWADGGYPGRLVDLARDVLRIALTVVRRTDATAGSVVQQKRWLVKRTFAWLPGDTRRPFTGHPGRRRLLACRGFCQDLGHPPARRRHPAPSSRAGAWRVPYAPHPPRRVSGRRSGSPRWLLLAAPG
ncbi:transposase [Streptomyces sp. DT20]|uniref:transposase n=1 Tax=Streptomyces sp. DT20 TaxID=3416519 RepID=UPI003CF7A14C